jgi:methylase of polypeptide subunit release factors
LIRRLLRDLRRVCDPGALALLEIGADQGEAVLQLARSLQPQQAEIRRDYADLDRILRIII